MYKSLVTLDTSVGLAILRESTMLRGFVIATSASRGLIVAGTAGLAALLTGLVRVNLAMGKLASANTTIRLAILAETVVLYIAIVSD